MSKGYRFWVDTETTGFSRTHDQIVELAGLIEDSNGNEVERFEFKIKLKQNVIPGPMAILINKINPYSKEWAKDSITENEAAIKLEEIVKRYTVKGGGIKPFFTAYNVDYDKDMCSVKLSRAGSSFSKLFNKSVFDPLKTARQMTASGKLVTKMNTYGSRQSPSNKLEDVAAALGVEYEGEAHRAMADVIVMRNTTKKLFKLATGYDMNGLSASPKEYKIGEVVKLVTDSKSSGAKVRHVYILENNVEREHIIVIDEDDLKINNGFKDTAVRQFNYGTIIGEMKPDTMVMEALSSLAVTKKAEIEILSKRKLKSDADEISMFDEETKNFPMIEQVQAHMSQAEDKRAAYEFMHDELYSKFNGDKLSAKAVMTRAENLACAKGLAGWTKELFPQEGVRVLQNLMPTMVLRVGLHPQGYYAIGLNYEKGGRPAKELKDCKSKKDILTFLNLKVGKVPEMVEFVATLPSPESFEDPKHPVVIETEIRNALDSIAVKGADDNVKAGVAGLLLQLQKISSKTFSKYKLPIDPSQINDENYWKGNIKKGSSGGPSGGGESNIPTADQLPQASENISSGPACIPSIGSDHVKPGDKLAKTPCALCGRALSANISIQHSMGPTCRKNLHVAEEQDGPLDDYRDAYKPYFTSSPPRPGDLVALRYRDQSGKDKEVLAEFITVTPSQTQIIDRRQIRKLLKAGINTNFAVYLSTTKIPHGTISGIAKLTPTGAEEDEENVEIAN